MTSKPRIIRQVIKRDRYDRPRVAIDRKKNVTLMLVRVATVPRPCRKCGGEISVGSSYARVSYLKWRYWVNGYRVPEERTFHWEHTPREVDRLLRFFGREL